MVDQKPDSIQPKTDNLAPDLPGDLRVAVSGGGTSKPTQSDVGGILSGELPVIGKKGRSRWWMIAGGAVFILLLLAGTAYLWLGNVSLGANQGTLKLALEPTGANITIDGKFKRQSVSSLSIKLKAGEHVLLVTKEGYLDQEQEFTLSANETKEVDIKLDTIPNIEVLVEGEQDFPELIRNGAALAYLTPGGSFSVMDLSAKEQASLFGGEVIPQIQLVSWAAGEPMALAKISGSPKLTNMYDNRAVRGRFVPLGERPVQGSPRNTGVSTWLLDDARQIAAGWQPVLLNESIGSADFSPDGSRIIYFYHTADGEMSLIVAHPDGGEWERLITQVPMSDPTLVWLNTDRYVLLMDDANGQPNQIFDLVSKNFSEVMSDRIADTPIASSPDGTRILYVSNDGGRKLAIWNLPSNSREKLFDKEVTEATRFVWQTDERFILNKDDGSLWYWDLGGKERPVQFISAVGALQPIKLLYSIINHQLLVVEQTRILSLKA